MKSRALGRALTGAGILLILAAVVLLNLPFGKAGTSD